MPDIIPTRQSFQCQVLRFDADWHTRAVTKFSVLQSPGRACGRHEHFRRAFLGGIGVEALAFLETLALAEPVGARLAVRRAVGGHHAGRAPARPSSTVCAMFDRLSPRILARALRSSTVSPGLSAAAASIWISRTAFRFRRSGPDFPALRAPAVPMSSRLGSARRDRRRRWLLRAATARRARAGGLPPASRPVARQRHRAP